MSALDDDVIMKIKISALIWRDKEYLQFSDGRGLNMFVSYFLNIY